MSTVLIMAAHPDDETLGCGGTILKHKERGDKVHWVIVTAMRKEDGFTPEEISNRQKEIEKVKEMYGFDGVIEMGISAKKVDTVPMDDMVNRIGRIMSDIRPEVIYLPFRGDVHSDHRVIFEAAYSCTKTFRYPFLKKILMMETISETEFVPAIQDSVFIPNYFVDITEYLEKKIEIMSIFDSELGKHPFPRSADNIKALATFRGAAAGCGYAESFMILKEIDRG